MYSEELEQLIKAALTDGVLTEKERQILFKRAKAEGVDLDEFEMILNARLYELQKSSSPVQASKTEKENTATNRSSKHGDVKKCPACGEIIESGIAVCGTCGYAFTESFSTASREKLYDALLKIEEKHDVTGLLGTPDINKIKKKATLKGSTIANFPIPNTKADLLDFLSYLVVLAKPSGPKSYYYLIGHDYEDLGYAYWQLYSSCINKAKISFANDPNFSYYYEKYEELLNDSKKFRLSRTAKFWIWWLVAMTGLMGLLAILASVE